MLSILSLWRICFTIFLLCANQPTLLFWSRAESLSFHSFFHQRNIIQFGISVSKKSQRRNLRENFYIIKINAIYNAVSSLWNFPVLDCSLRFLLKKWKQNKNETKQKGACHWTYLKWRNVIMIGHNYCQLYPPKERPGKRLGRVPLFETDPVPSIILPKKVNIGSGFWKKGFVSQPKAGTKKLKTNMVKY